jgi:16S rRNA (cytidine1402-2'-O)-methyltransferase
VADGLTLAVVTDAGMPGVSDPGYLVVRHALDAGVSVQVIPGVSALTTALSGSGLPIEEFVFLGFAPSRGAERKRWIAANLELEHRTAVMFEAPGRLSALLADLHEILGDRQVVVARELTKVHESWRRGRLSDVSASADVPARGECVVLVYDQDKRTLEDGEEPAEDRVLDLYRRLSDTPGLTRKGVIQQVAAALSVPSKRVYAIVERAKVSIE